MKCFYILFAMSSAIIISCSCNKGRDVTVDVPADTLMTTSDSVSSDSGSEPDTLLDEYDKAMSLIDSEGEDNEKGIELLTKLAEKGNVHAQSSLAWGYFEGELGEDIEKALYWYTKAADQGDYESQTRLAYIYERGWRTQKDPAKAKYWQEKADNNPNKTE